MVPLWGNSPGECALGKSRSPAMSEVVPEPCGLWLCGTGGGKHVQNRTGVESDRRGMGRGAICVLPVGLGGVGGRS